MFIFYDKHTGKVVYEGALVEGLGVEDDPEMIERLETSEWVNNVLPMGYTPDTVQCRWLDERDPDQLAIAQRALREEVEFQVTPSLMAADRHMDNIVFKGPRTTEPPPDAHRQQAEARVRLNTLRAKRAAEMTQAEKDEALDLMLLERTPPHEL